MRKLTLLLGVLLFTGAQILQAQRTVTGTVVDATDKQGIPGVQIVVKGMTSTGTITDVMGQYSLSVPDGATHLVYTFMGMATQEIAIEGKTTIDVVMQSDATAIEGVEIVTYGSARKVGTMVGAAQQVGGSKLQARPVANVMDALQGQVAGLQVYNNSGDPTATQGIRLHGVGSLSTTSAPLYIMDGIVIDGASVLAMNPNDFESMTVLKDASATSIYGSRATNGVIVITTKRGTRNQDAKITLRSQYGISQLAERRFYDQIMSSEELLNFYSTSGIMTDVVVDDIRAHFTDPKTGQLYNTNWYDEFSRNNTPTYQTDLSVSGGGEKTTYFISGSQFSQEGTAYGSSYDRYTARANVESQAKDWLKVGMNLLLSRDKRQVNQIAGMSAPNGGLVSINAPWIPIVDSNGQRMNIIDELSDYNAPFVLPEYEYKKSVNNDINSQLSGNFFVEIEPFKGFKIINRSGTDARDRAQNIYRLPSHEGFIDKETKEPNGVRHLVRQEIITMTTTNTMEYSFDIAKKHNFVVLAGQEGLRYSNIYTENVGSGLTDDRLLGLVNTKPDTRDFASGEAAYALLSFLGRADYNYNSRFFADFSVRNDRSSRFGVDNRSAWFWSVGGMWNMINEDFVKEIRPLTDLRLKVSYGTQGNSEIGNYTHLAQTGPTPQYNGNLGWGISNPGNSGLTWEKQAKLTTTLHVSLVNKYHIELGFYQRNTTAMLFEVPYPATTGFSRITGNVGSYRNTGIDLNVGADLIRTKDFQLGASLNFNYNKDKVMELFVGAEDGRWIIPGQLYSYVEGSSVMYYMPLYAGVDPNLGKQLWYLPGTDLDVPTRGATTYQEGFSETGLAQNTGKRLNAPIAGGFGLNASYKGFQLTADFAYVLGKWMLDNT
ncbi:MAG: SusC/RagA family TonB-linked outer membrane protein, partial [Bacteroidales bacterium]|nr:SusC/RagA family TonB-linked outer membrane protein [Bacteroidales bacterium]